jgi:hypothetical protein
VEERLHQEGFTKRQARTAFQTNATTPNDTTDEDEEDQWEKLYEDCLQWLCVHLEEDQLPEGFDPRGQTLDVVAHYGAKASKSQSSSSSSPESQRLATKYGLTDEDATWLFKEAEKGGTVEEVLWNRLCQLANFSTNGVSHGDDVDANHQLVEEEMECLESIFPSDCQVTTNDGLSSVVIKTPEELTLRVVYSSGQYPAVLPQQVILSGNWPERVGVAFHVEILKFLSTLALGEPMVFEIYGQIQLLLQTLEELPDVSLLSQTQKPSASVAAKSQAADPKSKQQPRPKLKLKRPRERGIFWSTPPKKTPPATAFPKLRYSMEQQRKGLPAGKVRSDFLSILKQADRVSSFLHLWVNCFAHTLA